MEWSDLSDYPRGTIGSLRFGISANNDSEFSKTTLHWNAGDRILWRAFWQTMVTNGLLVNMLLQWLCAQYVAQQAHLYSNSRQPVPTQPAMPRTNPTRANAENPIRFESKGGIIFVYPRLPLLCKSWQGISRGDIQEGFHYWALRWSQERIDIKPYRLEKWT